MKTSPQAVLYIGIIIALAALDGVSQPIAATTRYEQLLYELGAFPVAKLTKPYFTNGYPGKVYGKGERIDVDGWLPPDWAANYLTDAERKEYGIPRKALSYGQYMAMVDIDAYKRTRDPQLFLVMRFAMEDLSNERIAVSKADMLRVYEAQIGLEPFARPLLRGRLSSKEAMELIRTYMDEGLFDAGILPAPTAGDSAYVTFLYEQANAARWSIITRDHCHQLLLAMDDKAYRKPTRDFRLANVKTAQDWGGRDILYSGLIQLGDEASLSAVKEGLIHDPSTECRESILSDLQQQGEVARVIDAIAVIAAGKDDPHRATTAGRGPNQWRDKLDLYLNWAQTRKDVDDATLQKVREIVAMLQASDRARSSNRPPGLNACRG